MIGVSANKTCQADVRPSRYKAGMWVFVLHRVTGVLIALYGIVHLLVISTSRLNGSFDRVMEAFHNPVVLSLELLLLAAIMYHALNGFRILLFDMGIGVRVQKPLFWGLMLLGVIAFFLLVRVALPRF